MLTALKRKGNNMKHTPAPWIVKYTRTSKVNSHVILEQSNHHEITSVKRQCDEEESEANARLIAAAPELLEALEAYERMANKIIDGEKTAADFETLKTALTCYAPVTRAAIAKAKGE